MTVCVWMGRGGVSKTLDRGVVKETSGDDIVAKMSSGNVLFRKRAEATAARTSGAAKRAGLLKY